MMRAPTTVRLFACLLATLAAPACVVASDDEPEPTGDAAEAVAQNLDHHLYVVAHPDDDLLFMNPELAADIRAGDTVQTVVVTAGNEANSNEAFWRHREDGILAAYAYIAGVEETEHPKGAWTESEPVLAGKKAARFTLNDMPTVSVTFLRLPSGAVNGNDYDNCGSLLDCGSLLQLWNGTRSTLAALDAPTDPAKVFTKTDLKNVLRALLVETSTRHLHTLDSTGVYADSFSIVEEHSDHVFSARFALDASLEYESPHELSMYRSYNIEPDAINLSPAESADKREAYKRYDAFYKCYGPNSVQCVSKWNSYPGAYGAYMQRMSVIRRTSRVAARIAAFGSKCLDVPGGNTANGTVVQISDCVGAQNQHWRIRSDGEIRGIGGKCLDVQGTANGAPVRIWDCIGVHKQQWRVMTNGQIRGIGGRCLDVRDGSTANGTQVQLSDCVATAAQEWSVELDTPVYRSSAGDLGDADLGAGPSYYKSVRLADLNGDERADACARRAGGIYCALNTEGTLAPLTKYFNDYSDVKGWLPPEYGTTIQLGDINGDGRADVCGRGIHGLLCAIANAGGTAFSGIAWRTPSFSDASGMADSESYYGSLRLGDVNGDGFADACARKPDGIHCALNLGTGYFAEDQLFTAKFSDANGWLPASRGTTIQLGDINGDGKADVCGRGVGGIVCAVANASGTAFENSHAWAFKSGFSDASGWADASAYYGSIRLADLDGDGRADVCGRGEGGISCASSGGFGFGPMRNVMPRAFLDANGWRSDLYGPNFQIADMDHDGRPDVCGRGPNGLLCANAPAPAP